MEKIESQLLIYSGRVQGVGFRATTSKIAQGFSVTGYVRNLEDGRVELVVEGKESELKAFLNKVENFFKDHIDGKEASDILAQNRDRFEILRD